jgi:hypothetical protein
VVKDTAKSVGISGEPTLVHPEKDRKTLLDLMLGDVSQYLPDAEKMLEQHVGFYYLVEVGWGGRGFHDFGRFWVKFLPQRFFISVPFKTCATPKTA